jgi:carboxymethylenebutenolidase
VVLLPDMFWRAGPYGPIDVKVAFTDEAVRREIFERLIPSTNADRSMRDTGAFLNWLLARPEVKGDRVGLTGYCMGAVMSLRAAGTFPERIAASAGFHGGNLATDAADSPHLLAPHIKARVYVGGADQDAGFPPEQADRLREALTLAGVQNTVEIYAGAKHGYAPPDMPVYDEAASERHWRAMLNLFAETLRS